MRRTSGVLALALAAWALLGGRATAHVAPSTRENNRYLVLAPLGDRLRLVYILYMGEEPGRRARARMDRNRDGRIDEPEATAHGQAIAAEIAARLSLEVDGRPVALQWSSFDVGLDDPSAAGGSFAIDLIAWICFDRDVREHTIRFTDRFEIPTPGESELRIEESPGVRISRAEFAGEPTPARPVLDRRWMGGPGPLAGGYEVGFTVDPTTAVFNDGPCDAARSPRPRRVWIWLLAAVLGGALIAVVVLRRFPRRR